MTDLAGLRVEDAAVHDATHREILRWVRELGVAGLRVDHPDGLAEPGAYLDRLVASAPQAWITVEKILQADEELPASWPVAGHHRVRRPGAGQRAAGRSVGGTRTRPHLP